MGRVDSLKTLLVSMGLQVVDLRKPKIREMYDIEVLHKGQHLAYIRLFEGRPPYYRGWVEVYGVNWDLAKGGLEERLVYAASRILEQGETLFLEYVGDEETEKQLERGTPPEDTRLGRVLLSHGFSNITDMYFPEGFMEGGPKLRAIRSN